MIQSIRRLTYTLAILLFAQASQAAVINFSGAVTGFEDLGGGDRATPVGPFAQGEAFSGRLEIEDSAFAPGSVFGNADILDYMFNVGATSIVNELTAISGTVAADGNGLSAFDAFTNFDFLGPRCAGCSASISADSFQITSFAPGVGVINGSVVTALAGPVNDVPAPAGVGLLGLGLLALVGVRKRAGRRAVSHAG